MDNPVVVNTLDSLARPNNLFSILLGMKIGTFSDRHSKKPSTRY